MKLSYKLLILIVLVSLLPLLAAGVLAAVTTQKAFESQIKRQIVATSKRQSNSLDRLLEQNAAQLSIIANRLQLRLLIDQYNAEGGIKTREAITAIVNRTQKTDTTFQTLLVTNPRGIVISSSEITDIGNNYSDNPAFSLGKKGQVTDLVASRNGAPVQVLASPLYLGNKLIGIVIGEVPIELYSVITREYTDLGVTGESYIATKKENGKYFHVTPLRFEEKSILAELAYGPDVPYDYRQQQVLKIKRPLINGWSLITKIDDDEINAPVSKLQDVILITTGLTLVAAVVLGLIAARKIVRPIESMTAIVTRISNGDYSKRITTDSNDEIGILGSAFNQMTDSMLASQRRLEASIAALTQGFLIVDSNGLVILSNSSTRKLLKIEKETVVEGRFAQTVLSEVAGLDIQDALQRCFRGEFVDIPDLHLSGNSLRIFFSPVSQSERLDGAVILIVDETEERILQRSRDEFFSIASHELRTPLTAIRGNASLMQQFYPVVADDETLKEVVGDIYDSSSRLIGIVNDFLDVSRLEQNKIKFDLARLDVAAVAQTVVKEMASVAADKNTRLQIDESLSRAPKAIGDKDRVKQIVYNLVGNGLKFTENGVITISGQKQGSMLKISVSDTGVGMNAESQKLLFHKFQQANDNLFTRDSSRGTGLGLYISKIIVDKMGGSIMLDSSETGKGSVFSFTLPLAGKPSKKD